MTQDFYLRTEDIRDEEVLGLYVPTSSDIEIVATLKSKKPTILEGSRGTGKSFLMKVAYSQLLSEFSTHRVLPIYLTFWRSSLIQTNDPQQFTHWMLARLTSQILYSLKKMGLMSSVPGIVDILGGLVPGGDFNPDSEPNQLEHVALMYEKSYRTLGEPIDSSAIPSIDAFRRIVEETCQRLGIHRIVLLFDEAAHIFRPEQQRQFFSMFRDLRSPYMACKAAIYPGVTSFGDSFQPNHDATWLTINRNILDSEYVLKMEEIVNKQSDEAFIKKVSENHANFSILAYAACGNPRLLLKTVSEAPQMSGAQIERIIREFYRTGIWSEHSLLVNDYPGHKELVDWGRKFVERNVLPDLNERNERNAGKDKATCYFWIGRDAPLAVHEALRLLAYIGVVSKLDEGIKSKKDSIGVRYFVSLGCLFSVMKESRAAALALANNLSQRRYMEYHAGSQAFADVPDLIATFADTDITRAVLHQQLAKSVDVISLTKWQKSRLLENDMLTIGQVLDADEIGLQDITHIGPKRAKAIMKTAISSVLEYLSG
jgi:hypothetical protein